MNFFFTEADLQAFNPENRILRKVAQQSCHFRYPSHGFGSVFHDNCRWIPIYGWKIHLQLLESVYHDPCDD